MHSYATAYGILVVEIAVFLCGVRLGELDASGSPFLYYLRINLSSESVPPVIGAPSACSYQSSHGPCLLCAIAVQYEKGQRYAVYKFHKVYFKRIL